MKKRNVIFYLAIISAVYILDTFKNVKGLPVFKNFTAALAYSLSYLYVFIFFSHKEHKGHKVITDSP